MAPIAASSQSKSKLKAFRYENSDGQSDVKTGDIDKENINPETRREDGQMIPPPQPQPSSQISATKDTRDCPQTPLGKIPLSELLASGEDTSRAHLNLTPIERVLWDNSPHFSDQLPTTRKGRERAHSSSPASSSQNETSSHFARAKQAPDLQALQKALKTPKADPADDLWSRYSLHTNTVERHSPTAPAGGSFSHLLHSSSPQTPASHVQKDSGGLRRALSCIEWPTSAAKRRKLFHNNSQSHPLEKTNTDGQAVRAGKSRMSRVSLLVEKIHDGLANPKTHQTEESSSEPAVSSPVAPRQVTISSPPEYQSLLDSESQGVIEDVVKVLSQTAVASKSFRSNPATSPIQEAARDDERDSSDFDDDDLDLEMMETIGADISHDTTATDTESMLNVVDVQPETVSTAMEIAKKEKGIGRNDRTDFNPTEASRDDVNCSDVSFPSAISSSDAQAVPDNINEFDEDDTDVFAADLEDVCAKYDSQAQSNTKQLLENQRDDFSSANGVPKKTAATASPPKIAAPIDIQVLSDDEDFGDDSDFEQIAAECAEATQKQQVSQPQSSVCTLKAGSYVAS